jgi:chromosomal replication initiator protein
MKANDDSINMKQQWDKVLEKISQKINKPTYEAWVKPTFPISMENNVLVISTPNDFAKDWLDARYKEHFRDAIKEVSETTVEIDFIVQ